jgi:hypothetical protein
MNRAGKFRQNDDVSVNHRKKTDKTNICIPKISAETEAIYGAAGLPRAE